MTHVYGTTTALTPVAFAQSVQYLLSVVRPILSSAHALDRAVQLGVSQVQQKQVRQFAVAQRLNIKQSAFIKSRGLAASSDIVSNATTSSFTRENSHLYKRWLRGAEHFLQRAQQGYIPTSRSRYSPNLALDFGRTRLRFPASGRRKRSFDSMLHAFVKRVGPSRFRRAATLRFVRSRPQHNADFRVARLSTCVESALKRQRALIRKLGKIATLSTPWREVLNRRAAAASVQQASVVAAGKYRFMPLPATLLYKQRSRNVKQQSNALTFSLRALRVGVLRRALRRRRSERAFIDLRKAAIQRRTPLERSLRPGKLRWRKRLRRSARAKP